jgi:uncharacterized protein (DUF58 family)
MYALISRWIWKFLTHRLTQAGRWLIPITFIFTTIGSSSLDVQFYVPFVYLFGIWFVAVVCVPFVRPKISLSATYADRIRAGETLQVQVTVQQCRRFTAPPLTVLPHRLPRGLDAAPVEGAEVPALRLGETASVTMPLLCKQRGVQIWQGFRCETTFPFGLIRSYRNYVSAQKVLVYPAFTALKQFRIPSGRRYHPGGVALASNLGDSFEYIGSREYRQGDSIRDIDWRATARLMIPIVREYREEYFMRVGVVLDTHVPRGSRQEVYDNFERAVSVCAAVSDYMAHVDYIVDLFAAGPNLYHLTAGRSLAYLDQILDILACVNENPEEPFETLEPEILSYLSRITTVICIFTDWNETRRAFAERLLREGAGVKVVVVRDEPCTVNPAEGGFASHIPVISAEMFEAGVEEL